MDKWYTVYTNSHKENILKNKIERLGFQVYLPSFEKEVSHARKIKTVSSPLFPRYLFVKFNKKKDNWHKILYLSGVNQLLQTNRGCLSIDEDVIKKLKSFENSRGYIEINKVIILRQGSKINFLNKPLKGIQGIYKEKINNKYKFLVSLFGKEFNVLLPGSLFEPI